ncbi:transposase [Bacteroides fragilis]|nr:transposase [Bacteroides fragilis]MBU9024900.1 transposase [Bacteroides fragilis]MBU9085389.1 transposase [Bacteroides fragilis]
MEPGLRELLNAKPVDNGREIRKIEIISDHIHVFVKAIPSDFIVHIILQLKGYVFFMIRFE